MTKLLKFLLLSFGLFFFKYLISLTVGYVFPTYAVTADAVILNDSTQVHQQPFTNKISELWNKQQSVHFVDIVVNGYNSERSPNDLAAGELINWSLYPLYPTLIKMFVVVFPIFTSINSIYVIGALLSTLFFGLALYFLDKLLDLLWIQDDFKYVVYLLLLFFPGSFYFNLVYSEALFLFLSVLGLFMLFSKRYWAAFLILALLVVTKFVGILLLVPYLFYFFLSERYNRRLKVVPRGLLFVGIVAFPLLVFYTHLLDQTGDFFAAFKAQGSILSFMYLPLGYFFDYFQNVGMSFRPELFLNFLLLVAAIAFTVYAFVRIFLVFEFRSPEQSTLFVYLAIFVLFLSAMSKDTSFFRYLSICLPLFILPSVVFPVHMRSTALLSVLFVFLFIQGLFFITFLTGIPIYL